MTDINTKAQNKHMGEIVGLLLTAYIMPQFGMWPSDATKSGARSSLFESEEAQGVLTQILVFPQTW